MWAIGIGVTIVLFFVVIQTVNDVPALAQEKSIKIGCLFPMTGRAGRHGVDGEAQVKMTAEEINNKGGVRGEKIELLFTDSKADPAYSVRVAKRYIEDDKVDFLLGTVSSAVALAVSEVAKENKKIFMCTGAASTTITVDKGHPYVFNACSITAWSSRAGALWAQSEPKWKRFWYIGPDYEYGHTLWADFWPFLKKLHPEVELVGESWPKLFEPDYTAYITAILKAKPDVLVAGFWGGDMVSFIKQAGPYKLFNQIKFLAPDVGGNYEVLEAIGEDMPKGLILGAHHHLNWPDTKLNREHVERFYKRVGHYPVNITPQCEAGVRILANAVEIVGNTKDAQGLIKAMEGMKINTPLDPPGYISWVRPLTHNLVYPYALGLTERNEKYPPAKYMLGNFRVFYPDKIDLTDAEVLQARAKAK
jgi:branched-chain amino acid transport system substrate-binding protein